MKKIGILTMHRVQNYGSALQAYALQAYISKLGYDVELIDYIYPNAKHKQHLPLKRRIKQFLFKLAFYLPLCRKAKRFARFYSDYYNCSAQQFPTAEDLMVYDYPYDVLVTGSDQVWNPIHILNDTVFFLPFARPETPTIAYAPSFSVASIPEEFTEAIRPHIEAYDYISVREKSGLDIVRSLTHREAELVCDPTLLLTGEEWGALAERSDYPIDGPYILVYVLQYAYNPYPDICDIIAKVQQELSLPLVLLDAPVLEMKFENARFVKDAGPLDFLRLMKNASYVITTSFHGTAFALNFSKPFYSVIRDRSGFDTRMTDLVDAVGADRAIVYNQPIDKPIAMDYTVVGDKVQALRLHSQEYINRSLAQALQEENTL